MGILTPPALGLCWLDEQFPDHFSASSKPSACDSPDAGHSDGPVVRGTLPGSGGPRPRGAHGLRHPETLAVRLAGHAGSARSGPDDRPVSKRGGGRLQWSRLLLQHRRRQGRRTQAGCARQRAGPHSHCHGWRPRSQFHGGSAVTGRSLCGARREGHPRARQSDPRAQRRIRGSGGKPFPRLDLPGR